jgi:chromosome segregation ATPase
MNLALRCRGRSGTWEQKQLMKYTIKMATKRILNIIGCALALALVAGCATEGYDKGSAAGSKLQQTADRIAASETAVADCVTALNDLSTNAAPDMRPQFKTLEGSIKKLESLSQSIGSNHLSIQAKGQAYFAKWDAELAQIHNEDIRSRSEARRKEVSVNFEKIKAAYEKTRGNFEPFLADLKDIQRALSIDLNPPGIEAVRSSIQKANRSSESLRESLKHLSEEFRSLGVAISPAAPGVAKPSK